MQILLYFFLWRQKKNDARPSSARQKDFANAPRIESTVLLRSNERRVGDRRGGAPPVRRASRVAALSLAVSARLLRRRRAVRSKLISGDPRGLSRPLLQNGFEKPLVLDRPKPPAPLPVCDRVSQVPPAAPRRAGHVEGLRPAHAARVRRVRR